MRINMAAYARDLKIPYIMHDHDLTFLVTSFIEKEFNCIISLEL